MKVEVAQLVATLSIVAMVGKILHLCVAARDYVRDMHNDLSTLKKFVGIGDPPTGLHLRVSELEETAQEHREWRLQDEVAFANESGADRRRAPDRRSVRRTRPEGKG